MHRRLYQHSSRFLSLAFACLWISLTITLAYSTPRDRYLLEPSEIIPEIGEGVIIEAIGSDEEEDRESELSPLSQSSIQQVNPREITLAHAIWQYNRALNPLQSRYLAHYILKFSHFYELDYRLVTGMIAVESSFRPDAVSSSGAIGLGQLKPATAKWLGVNNPYHPADNIAGMTRYLKYLLNKYHGHFPRAIAAYYQGPGSVDRQGISPQSQPYLKKVEHAMARF